MSNYHKTRLKDLVRDRLAESGWIDEMRAVCRGIIQEKGVENVTEESLVEERTPEGRDHLFVLQDLKGRTSIPVLFFGVRFSEDSWAHGPGQPLRLDRRN
ncbi:hypothetical protein TNCV_2991141 [Trichonephila clavipes]|nr:hypothetical protein TNCV_2991141 [Trichonephila clavipes]